jgi:hypothetical protein
LTHARILLKADGGAEGPGWDDAAIAEGLEVGRATVERVRKEFVEEGLEAALEQMLSVALREQAAIINIAMHSSEMMVGGSPRSRVAAEVDGIFSRLASMLSILASSPLCQFTTLTDAARHWRTSNKSSAKLGPYRKSAKSLSQ